MNTDEGGKIRSVITLRGLKIWLFSVDWNMISLNVVKRFRHINLFITEQAGLMHRPPDFILHVPGSSHGEINIYLHWCFTRFSSVSIATAESLPPSKYLLNISRSSHYIVRYM